MYICLYTILGKLVVIGRYVEGGMGSVSMAIARAAQEAGATLVTNVEVMNLPIMLLLPNWKIPHNSICHLANCTREREGLMYNPIMYDRP
jgi:hypothetical protein